MRTLLLIGTFLSFASSVIAEEKPTITINQDSSLELERCRRNDGSDLGFYISPGGGVVIPGGAAVGFGGITPTTEDGDTFIIISGNDESEEILSISEGTLICEAED